MDTATTDNKAMTWDRLICDKRFGLEFPTLTQDTYRKVRSIVNTTEMMNRQIIYLLALNNNSFIGDFDIEYLLNRRGTIRLKAYNRYNDQNYYLKTALTTQGVGIMFKRDFDNILSFLRKYRKPAAGADSIKLKAVKIDSVAVKTPSDTTIHRNTTNPDFIQIRHK